MNGAISYNLIMNNELDDRELMIPEAVVVRIVTMLGQVSGMESDLNTKRRKIMSETANMVNADGWLWSATKVDGDRTEPVSVGLIHGGLSDEAINGWAELSNSIPAEPPEHEPLGKLFLEGKHFTRTRRQIVADDIWYSNPCNKINRLDHGIDDFMYSIYPLEDNSCSAIGFYKKLGRSPFTAMERRICHIIFSNIDWIHRGIFPENKEQKTVELSHRRRTVLIHLLDGRQRAEIAELLCLSPQTIKSHVSSIYHHFGVSSQVELMRYFQSGNGKDLH